MSELIKAKQEKRKLAMIRSFMGVFSKYGLDGAYVRRLAKGAKETEATVYRHFKNKDDVIKQCSTFYHVLTQKELTDIIMMYIDQLDLLPEKILNYVDTVIDVCRFLMQVMAHPTYCDIMLETSKQVEAYILSFAATLEERYRITKADSEGAAIFMNSIVNDYILKKSKERFMLQYGSFKKLITQNPAQI